MKEPLPAVTSFPDENAHILEQPLQPYYGMELPVLEPVSVIDLNWEHERTAEHMYLENYIEMSNGALSESPTTNPDVGFMPITTTLVQHL